jgi:hypothetical protein
MVWRKYKISKIREMEMMEYKIEDFMVINISGKKLDFHYKIEKVFDLKNMLISFSKIK